MNKGGIMMEGKDSFDEWEKSRKEANKLYNKLKEELQLYPKEDDKVEILLNKVKELESKVLMLQAENEVLTKKVARGGRKQKFTDQDKVLIKMYRLQGKTVRELAEIFDCSVGLIHKLISD